MLARHTDGLWSIFRTCRRWYGKRLHGMPSPHCGFKSHGRWLQCMILGTLGLMAALSWLTPAFAATYYVDPATGTNTNNGTSSTTPWQNPPGTRTPSDLDSDGCNGFISCTWGDLSTTPLGPISTTNKIQCGDVILLKGGEHADKRAGWCMADRWSNRSTLL